MSEVSQLEKQKEKFKGQIALGEIAERLASNPDFKKLIMDEFCVQECARYCQLSADPALSPVERADSLALAQAAGHLRRWLSVQIQMAAQHRAQLVDLDEAIEEARREEADAEAEREE